MTKQHLQVRKKTDGTLISSQCIWARNSWSRLVGLLGHSSLAPEESLLIEPCKQVHTWFMRFPIDVVFLSKNNEILDCKSMMPWKLSPLNFKASKILELPLGACKKFNCEIGEVLSFEAEATDA